jgi:ATPase subunit of ABC transporter with duplicated ATPase domains
MDKKEYKHKHYIANKEKYNKKSKKYREENKEELKKYFEEYRRKNSMKNYIAESARAAQNRKKDHQIFGRVMVQITNPLPDNVNIQAVIKKIESDLPEHIIYDVDAVYVGDFQMLNDRQVDSLYISGSVMVSNEQSSNKQLFDTLIHEFAHAVEEVAGAFIYGDNEVRDEFLLKRLYLYNILKEDYRLNKKLFKSTQFSQELDDLFNKEIGYENLGVITSNLFLSPYACTDLREYFANGFEHYYRSSPEEVKRVSPAVYRKVIDVLRGKYL